MTTEKAKKEIEELEEDLEEMIIVVTLDNQKTKLGAKTKKLSAQQMFYRTNKHLKTANRLEKEGTKLEAVLNRMMMGSSRRNLTDNVGMNDVTFSSGTKQES